MCSRHFSPNSPSVSTCVSGHLAYRLKPVGEVGIVADRCLPDGGDEAEAVHRVAAVEVDRGGVHHFAAAYDNSQVPHRLDGTDAEPAVELTFKALAPRGEKVTGPAIEADTVDEVRRTLGWFQIVLAAGVVRIADAAVAVAMIDAVLAPDLALADVNSLLRGEVVAGCPRRESPRPEIAGDIRCRPWLIMCRSAW